MTGEVSPVGPPADLPADPPADPRGRPIGNGGLRASHEDRDSVVEQLRVAAGDGRLTADELDDRLELALTARTYRELAVLTADLPAAAGSGGLAMPGAATPEPRELVRIQCGSGHTGREGPWVVPQRMEIAVTSGSVKLDFTAAAITGRKLQIAADVRSGSLLLVTKPGIVVDSGDVTVSSGSVKAREPWAGRVPEILRIEITGRVRTGSITARPPRRTFWQWLRRAPRPYEDSPRQIRA
jgi:Domain of unknown function (DUF1707)